MLTQGQEESSRRVFLQGHGKKLLEGVQTSQRGPGRTPYCGAYERILKRINSYRI